MKSAVFLAGLICLAACNTNGTYYPSYPTDARTATTPKTSGTGISVTGSARTGVVYGPS